MARPKTGATNPAAGGTVGLDEGRKDGLLFFGGDADAGVHHAKAELDVAVDWFGGPNFEGDLAFFREFEGVAEEIDENLAEADGIANQFIRNGGRHIGDEFQRFLRGADAEGLDDISDQLAEAKVNIFELHETGLDFGKVEDVIDDGQEGAGGFLGEGEVFPLFVGEVGVEGEIGHSENAVHGGADFVTHICHKFAFGAVGFFRLQFGGAKLAFRFLANGDFIGQSLIVHGEDLAGGEQEHLKVHDADGSIGAAFDEKWPVIIVPIPRGAKGHGLVDGAAEGQLQHVLLFGPFNKSLNGMVIKKVQSVGLAHQAEKRGLGDGRDMLGALNNNPRHFRMILEKMADLDAIGRAVKRDGGKRQVANFNHGAEVRTG